MKSSYGWDDVFDFAVVGKSVYINRIAAADLWNLRGVFLAPMSDATVRSKSGVRTSMVENLQWCVVKEDENGED